MDAPSAAELPAAVEKLEAENQLLQIKNAVSASPGAARGGAQPVRGPCRRSDRTSPPKFPPSLA